MRADRGGGPPVDHAGARPVAFVLSSGASLGAAQVGMLKALLEHLIFPDLVLGSSIGALNGAALADDPTLDGVDRLAEVWRTVDAGQIIPRGLLPTTVALARRAPSVQRRDALRRVLEENLAATTFRDLRLPFHCVATDLADECEVWFHSGRLVDAVLASAAVPTIFPPVEVSGRRYIDGATVNDAPVTRAAELGARTIYVLAVGGLARPGPSLRRAAGAALHAYWIGRRHHFRRQLESLPPGIEVCVMPDGDPEPMRFYDFSNRAELISRAHVESSRYLDAVCERRIVGRSVLPD